MYIYKYICKSICRSICIPLCEVSAGQGQAKRAPSSRQLQACCCCCCCVIRNPHPVATVTAKHIWGGACERVAHLEPSAKRGVLAAEGFLAPVLTEDPIVGASSRTTRNIQVFIRRPRHFIGQVSCRTRRPLLRVVIRNPHCVATLQATHERSSVCETMEHFEPGAKRDVLCAAGV